VSSKQTVCTEEELNYADTNFLNSFKQNIWQQKTVEKCMLLQ